MRVLPPISQPGRPPTSAAAARSVVTAQFRPKVPGRPAILELRRDGRWRTVTTARLDAQGRVSFTPASRVSGQAATYRVRGAAYANLPSVHSKPTRTDVWGAPAFIDEFGGSTLGPAWGHRGQLYNPPGGRMSSKGDPAAVAVGNGALRLSVLRDPARDGDRFIASGPGGKPAGSHAYRLNGHVSTEGSFSFRYGVAAARMRFQHARGQHPSFWMQPAVASSGSEVDIVEWFGAGAGHQHMATNIYPHPDYENKGTAFGGRIHDPDQYLQGSNDTWWTGYHVFSVEWTPREYVFRIDGQETLRSTRGVSQVPEFLILSMLSSDFELGLLGGDGRLPQHAYVDWVQVWTGN